MREVVIEVREVICYRLQWWYIKRTDNVQIHINQYTMETPVHKKPVKNTKQWTKRQRIDRERPTVLNYRCDDA